ncbi:ABC transporter substrate-binding protein [Paenibacillus sp. GCM10012307]|uniref:Extracellular solute-binding protein n=1 Tax=Paenibacillus roseus TaxID=2798579 RepID=A0A934MW06_9BACL|nr:extracellular solute-binding protein [Paenibacillus roseus]MBJ6362667.1 extracellular solute-binding protein [Paenibacillus roseus]
MKRALILVMMFALTGMLLAACGGNKETTPTNQPPQTNKEGGANTKPEGEQVKLKFFSALADRSNGPGKIEQNLIDAYMNDNPNVKIEVEALQDEPYKAKMKVYASSNDIPDIIQSWGQASFIKPLINAGLLLELNEADFASSKFVAGATDGFSQDGKLYGLPRNTDFFVVYYNKKLFEDHGVKVPGTTQELKEAAAALRKAGVNPIASNGMDGWSLPIWFEYVAQRHNGDFNKIDAVLNGQATFSGDADFLAAATEFQEFAVIKGLADGFITADYGTSRNMFGQGQAAMYLMGNWEAGLATDENFPEDFRNNVGAIPYPASDKGKTTDVAAWFGGGYSVAKNSKHPEEAVKFLQYFFAPENWAKQLWQTGSGTPAQNFDEFLTGDETELQKQLIGIFSSISSSSGTPVQDNGTDEFKTKVMEAHQNLLSQLITPEAFLKELDAAVALIK